MICYILIFYYCAIAVVCLLVCLLTGFMYILPILQLNEQNNGREYSQSENKVVETVQGHDKETTTGPVKAIKRIKKPKVSKHTSGTSNSGAIEGMLMLISLFTCMHSFDDKSSTLSFLTRLVRLMAIYWLLLVDGLTFFLFRRC